MIELAFLLPLLAVATVIVTSPEDLERIVEERVEAALLRVLPEAIRRATEPEYMTREEAADFAQMSVRSLDYRVKRKDLPSIKRGNKRLIPTAALREYLDEAKIPAKH